MPSESRITLLLSELTKQTATGELAWSVKDPPDTLTRGTNDVYAFYFEANFKGQKIGVAERRYQAYDGEHDRLYWTEELVLLFRDMFGRVTWEHRSQQSALYTLFETIREQVADVDGVLKKLLGEADDEL